MYTNPEFKVLEEKGIFLTGFKDYQLPHIDDDKVRNSMLRNANVAEDAQPGLVTSMSGGVPAFLATYIHPQLIKTLIAPMKAAEVAGGETKIGSWTDVTSMFPNVEFTGQVTAYGDHNEGGNASVNVSFPQRQSFDYQVMTPYGFKELERAALVKVDLSNQIKEAAFLTLNKFQNKTYLLGVTGLQNYGLLNDPNLSSPITPDTKTAGGTYWSNATALEILNDIKKMFTQLVTQLQGNIDQESPLTLVMSTSVRVHLSTYTNLNVKPAIESIKETYPNIRIVTVPEYSTSSGEFVQLIAPEINGQRTLMCCFNEKLRAFPVVVRESSYNQKFAQGTWGTVIFKPVAIVGMLGV